MTGNKPTRSSLQFRPRHLGIYKGRSLTGYEDEEIRSVAETIVPGCYPVERVIRNVVEKDRPIRHPTKEVESVIPAFCRKGCCNAHGLFLQFLSRRCDRSAGATLEDRAESYNL
jgi:hypothetical protein